MFQISKKQKPIEQVREDFTKQMGMTQVCLFRYISLVIKEATKDQQKPLEDSSSLLATGLVSYLMGEDVSEWSERLKGDEKIFAQAILPLLPEKSAEIMNAEKLVRELIVYTLRMKMILAMNVNSVEKYVEMPEYKRVTAILSTYGHEFPKEADPDEYAKMVIKFANKVGLVDLQKKKT